MSQQVIDLDGNPVKQRKVIPEDDARKIQRAIGACLSNQIQMMFVCPECEKEGREPLLTPALDGQTNELLMECQCTIRLFEKVIL